MLASDCLTAGTTWADTSRRPRRVAMARPNSASTTAMTTSSRLLLGIENAAAAPSRPGEEHEQQDDVDDPAGDDVEADAGDRLGRRDTGLLQVAHVERHAADVRRASPG